MNDYLVLILGVACAAGGGELFVRGAVGLAGWARISPGIIGATVAAFATSSPELSVSISSSLAGKPQIALGDALGSNVVNIALILAIALIISDIHTPRDNIKRDYSVALLVPILTALLSIDGVLSRIDGIVMLCVFSVWLVSTAIEANKQRNAAEAILGERQMGRIVASCLLGLGLLVAAGNLIVLGAKGIAISFGMEEFVIGATVVAIGTSAPELATTIIAKARGHEEVGLGTVIGSNIFNGLFIVAVAAIITPIHVDWQEIAVALTFGFVVLFFVYPSQKGAIERWRGPILLVAYGVYVTIILQSR